MPDWNGFVRDHLPAKRRKREREEEVIAELGQQLEDFYREALTGGASEEEAVEYARRQIPDWEALARGISGSSRSRCRPAFDRWYEQAETAAMACATGGHVLARLLADLRKESGREASDYILRG